MKTMRDDDWSRCYISLISKAKPRLRDGKDETEEARLWQVLSELTEKHGSRVTLDQIVERCEYRRFAELFKGETSIRRSVIWHLRNWAKPDHNIVKIEF